MQGTVEVTDLFKGAFLLCMGGRLDQVRVRNNGRRIATFLITGPDLDRLDSDYRSGRALVNPVQLRESLNHLRDVMFEKLRNHKAEGRYKHANRQRGGLVLTSPTWPNECHDRQYTSTNSGGLCMPRINNAPGGRS
jgi:hypothetical protein